MDVGSALDEVQERIGYRFEDRTLLEKALTHSSYRKGIRRMTDLHHELASIARIRADALRVRTGGGWTRYVCSRVPRLRFPLVSHRL